MPDMAFPRVSGLDDPDILTPQMVVHASRAPFRDHMDSGLPSFAEMPDGDPEKVQARSDPATDATGGRGQAGIIILPLRAFPPRIPVLRAFP